MIKLKQILTWLLVTISTCSFAQLSVPTLVSSQKYSAKGSGASGVPTVTFNVPTGHKNMMLMIWVFAERYHNPRNGNVIDINNSAYLTEIKANNILATNYLFRGLTNRDTSSQIYQSALSQMSYLSEANGLTVGNNTITFPTIRTPQSVADEMEVIVTLYENVKGTSWIGGRADNPATTLSSTTLTKPAPIPPIGRVASHFLYAADGFVTQEIPLILSSGWNITQNEVISNLAGSSDGAFLATSGNEQDGISSILAHRYITDGTDPFITLSRASSTRVALFNTEVLYLIPFASPSIAGNIYQDTDGATNINGAGTNAGGTYVNVINSSNNLIYSATVSAAGAFTIPTGYVEEGNTYRLELSKNTGTIGATAPLKALPSGWATVGENATGVSPYPNDGTHDGIINLTIGSTNITGLRYGINQVCSAATTAPTIQNLTNICPATYVDLNTAHTGTIPAGSSLVWFNNNTHTGTALSGTQITQAGSGTYYAFYFDSINNCYSPASSAVIATINPCFVCPPDPYAAQQTWWLADGFRTPIHPVIIDFKTGSPVVSTPSTGYGNGFSAYTVSNGLGYEGNTTVTHPITKEFLFATDGNTLFRASDGAAATGTNVGGGKSAGEAAAVIPDPNGILGQSFLILGNTSWNTPGGLNMSKYDLATNTLTNLTTLLPSGTIYEGLEVIPHTNGNDYWILVNTTDQKVKSYLYSKTSGFNSTAVSSTDVINLAGVNPSFIATCSFISWDPRNPGKLLISRHNKVGLASFNPSTGVLGTWDVKVSYSTGFPDDDSSLGYSVALSPNGRYIYYKVDYDKVMYYDLQTSTSSQLATINAPTGFKIGPDDKLYIVGYPSFDPGLYYYATPDSPSPSTSTLPLLNTSGYTVPLQLPNNVYWGCLTCQSGTASPALANTNITSNPATVGDLIALLSASNQPAGTVITIHSATPAMDINKLANSTAIVAGTTYYASFYDGLALCYSPTTAVTVGSSYCYKPAVLDLGNIYNSKHGITSLGRAGTKNENWPMVRQSAWSVLESKTKGLVVNRVRFNASNQPVADDGTALVITNPVEGMMVYDKTNNCLKMYTSNNGGSTFQWHCMTTQACPN